MDYEIALASITLVVLVFLSIVESAHGCLSDLALRSLASEAHSAHPARARFLRYLLEHRQLFWLTLSFGIQAAIILLTLVLADLMGQLQIVPVGFGIPVVFVATVTLVLIFRQFLPRLLVQNSPGPFLMRLLPIFEPYFRVTALFVFPVHEILKTFRESQDLSVTPDSFQNTGSDEDLKALIDVGEEEGIIEESDSELIQSIIEFGDTVVKEVMTKRSAMVCIEDSATIEQVRDLMVQERHSRLPVYQGNPDNIVGVVYVRDLLGCWSENQTTELVGVIARPAYFVPENKSVADLLEDMQKSKTQIALVIDEFGGVAGLVTIEDILEEIVGEIEDEDVEETSPEELEIVEEAEGWYLVKGSTEIRKIELLFDVELEADDFTTVNGLIIKSLERVPNVGEQFFLRGLHIEILEADGRAIRRVRLQWHDGTESTMANRETEAANSSNFEL